MKGIPFFFFSCLTGFLSSVTSAAGDFTTGAGATADGGATPLEGRGTCLTETVIYINSLTLATVQGHVGQVIAILLLFIHQAYSVTNLEKNKIYEYG